jgi:hypothetical protein
MELTTSPPTTELSIPRICRDCGTPFDIEPDEAQWFVDAHLSLPRRCPACRRRRRLSTETGGAA